MADDLRIELNRAAIRDQLLKSPEIMSICSAEMVMQQIPIPEETE